MRVCLTNPPWNENGKKGIRAGCRVPNIIGDGELTFIPFPFMLAYATANLEAENIPVMILDAIGENINEDEYYKRVAAFKPDLIVNEIATASYKKDIEIAANLKKLTGAKIAICGPHPSALPEDVLNNHPFIDYIFIGEMEDTLLDLVKALQCKISIELISGLAYRKDQNEIVVKKRKALIPDLDKLPYPHRKTLPMKTYCVSGHPKPVLFIYASRGCPFHCNYCLWPQTMYEMGNYRYRSPENIVKEIKYTNENFGPFNSIYFDDDTFNVGKERMLLFAQELRKHSIKLPWGCNARADLFDEELMKILSNAGMFNIRIGIESGDPEIIKRANKNLNLDAVKSCIKLARKYKVKTHATFTIGLSGESLESIERTIKFTKSIHSDSIAFTLTTPYPGTAYYKEVINNGFLKNKDWEKFNCTLNSVVRTETMSSEEIIDASKFVMKKVYSSPYYIFRRLFYCTSFDEFISLIRKGTKILIKK